jgi:hypothetical protein
LGDTVPTVPRINVDLPADLHRRLKVLAAERGTSLKAVVVELLEKGSTKARRR